MRHVEVAKEEKLADTMRSWYASTKVRQAEYAQQLATAEAAVLKTSPADAVSGPSSQDDMQVEATLVSCKIWRDLQIALYIIMPNAHVCTFLRFSLLQPFQHIAAVMHKPLLSHCC